MKSYSEEDLDEIKMKHSRVEKFYVKLVSEKDQKIEALSNEVSRLKGLLDVLAQVIDQFKNKTE